MSSSTHPLILDTSSNKIKDSTDNANTPNTSTYTPPSTHSSIISPNNSIGDNVIGSSSSPSSSSSTKNNNNKNSSHHYETSPEEEGYTNGVEELSYDDPIMDQYNQNNEHLQTSTTKRRWFDTSDWIGGVLILISVILIVYSVYPIGNHIYHLVKFGDYTVTFNKVSPIVLIVHEVIGIAVGVYVFVTGVTGCIAGFIPRTNKVRLVVGVVYLLELIMYIVIESVFIAFTHFTMIGPQQGDTSDVILVNSITLSLFIVTVCVVCCIPFACLNMISSKNASNKSRHQQYTLVNNKGTNDEYNMNITH